VDVCSIIVDISGNFHPKLLFQKGMYHLAFIERGVLQQSMTAWSDWSGKIVLQNIKGWEDDEANGGGGLC
jgi:hypothetical protein